ncbi:hypothetical protein M092_0193 [Parabacteroides distasonis str. 3776 D15 iv]|uniref:Uncharacterized protein n=1 Tax=Parabacteroides distasonis str. 3776 D15 i TaxID=1339342 RepID=A0AB34L924_PARDI|nr:hypothetical protein M091_0104 [Parabacteroides distasonis str. 3776 D15 i]KDS74021.1 hypothetical protein M092_0193 [Parabacteroides distasonis str. 3776 D15 iv]
MSLSFFKICNYLCPQKKSNKCSDFYRDSEVGDVKIAKKGRV